MMLDYLLRRFAKVVATEMHRLEKIDADIEKIQNQALASNPFCLSHGGWNLTEQSRLLCDDIDTARRLAAEASVTLPAGPFERAKVGALLPNDYDPARHVDGIAPRVSDEAPIIKAPKAKQRRHLRIVKSRPRARAA